MNKLIMADNHPILLKVSYSHGNVMQFRGNPAEVWFPAHFIICIGKRPSVGLGKKI